MCFYFVAPWDEPSTLLKHQTSRLYLIKILNIFINVFTSFVIAHQQSIWGLSVAYDAVRGFVEFSLCLSAGD